MATRETMYGLTPRDLATLRWLIAKVRTQLPTLKGKEAQPPVVRDPSLAWVRLLSSASTSSRYPGVTVLRDTSAQTWTDDDTAAQQAFTATLTSGSEVLTGCSTTSGFLAGDSILSTSFPYGAAVIDSVDGSTQLTLNRAATASHTGAVLLQQRGTGGYVQQAFTGDRANTSAVIQNILTTVYFVVGDPVTGTAVPANAIIKTIDSPTQITLDQPCTATLSSASFTRHHSIWVEAPNGETLALAKNYLARAGDYDGSVTPVYTVDPGIAVASGATFNGVNAHANPQVSIATGAGYTTINTLVVSSGGYDVGGYYSAGSPSRITAPATGKYHVAAQASWGFDAAASQHRMRAFLNGTTVVLEDIVDATAAGDSPTNRLAFDVLLTAGDYLELTLKHGSGSAISTTSVNIQAHFLGS